MKKQTQRRKPVPYAEAIKTAEFKRALAKSIAAKPERKTCMRGHNLISPKAGHIHVGDLMRLGVRNCRTCWQKQQKAYEAKLAAKQEAK